MAAKIRSGALEAKGTDRWFVTDGLNAVGPVRLDLLSRGVAAGRVPLDSFVRHDSWKVWRPLADFTEPSNDGGVGPENPPSSLSAWMSDELSRETMELSGADFMASGEIPVAGHDVVETAAAGADAAQDGRGEDPPTELGRDLLGANRPDLSSYLDDEETQVPQKRALIEARKEDGRADEPGAVEPQMAQVPTDAVPPPPAPVPPPRPLSVPPRPLSVPPRPLSAPPRPVSSPPARPPGSIPPRPLSTPPPRPLSTPPPRPQSPSVPSLPLPPRSGGPEIRTTDDIVGLARPADSVDRLPEDDLAGANDLSEGLLLLLGAAVKRSHADAAMLHRMADDGATIQCAHGPKMVEVLGMRTRLLDAAVVAAAGGHIVVAEPAPGPAGDATLNRLRKLGVDPEAALMFPLRPRGRLLGLLELGKGTRFTPREVAAVDALVLAFVARAESAGWTP
jgi:hypothetical protein